MSLHVPAAVAAYAAIALATGLAARWRGRRYVADSDSDPETAYHLRRLRQRGVTVGWALTAAVTWGTAIPESTVAVLAPALPDAAAEFLGTFAAYLLPAALVAVAVRLATVPYRSAVRGLRVRYRDAAAWELERDGIGALVVLSAAGAIALTPPGYPRAVVAVALGFVGTALAPVALVVALRTRWPTDEELDDVASLLPSGVRLRVVDDRTRVGSAFAAGVIPGLEYVFVTESLFDVLDDDELRAVVAHEVGHHEENHVLLRFSLVGVAAGIALAVASSAAETALLGIVVGALPFALVLAWVVRRTEREADACAAEAVSGAALASALETLAERRYVIETTGALGAFAYHPPLGERIDGLRARGERRSASTQ